MKMKVKLNTSKDECMLKIYAQADYLSDLGYYGLARNILLCLSKENFAWASHALAVGFLNGRGVKKNKSKALYFFKKAVALKDPIAMFNLGLFYRDDVRKYKKALYWI